MNSTTSAADMNSYSAAAMMAEAEAKAKLAEIEARSKKANSLAALQEKGVNADSHWIQIQPISTFVGIHSCVGQNK